MYRFVHDQSQNTEQFHLYDHIHLPSPSPSLTPGDRQSVLQPYNFIIEIMLYKWNHVIFGDWLFSFSMILLRPIQAVACVNSRFLLILLSNIFMVWISHSLFNHSTIEGYLGSFQLLTIMNKAALYIRIRVFTYT